jgi:uncharacterized protein YbjT (DUF2867 family)
MSSEERELRCAVFGATGLVGTGVVHALLGDGRVREVRAVTRRPIRMADPRLEEVRCEDFLDLAPIARALTGIDAVCFCLGISASQVGAADYRRITHDFALAAGRSVAEASPEAVFHFVSGSGAGEQSLMRWARVKAETERDLHRLGLGGAVAYRPAMILPAAEPDRLTAVQRLGGALAAPFRSLTSLSVDNTAIGEAMLQATFEGRRDGVLDNRAIRALADRYQAHRP